MKPSDYPYAEQYSKSGDCSRSRAAPGSVVVNLTYNEDEGWSDGYKSYPALASPIAELFRFRRVKPGMKIQISTPNDEDRHPASE